MGVTVRKTWKTLFVVGRKEWMASCILSNTFINKRGVSEALFEGKLNRLLDVADNM